MPTRRLMGTATSSSVPDNGGDHSGGGAGGYVDDVFSTYLYTGNGSTQTITNGVDLAGEDGMVWLKSRGESKSHRLIRNDNGTLKSLSSDTIDAENANPYITSFNSDGFTLGDGSQTNGTGQNYASWTFRKAKNFFDVVTYTGDKVQGREIPHNLGCVPGMIIIKSASNSSGNWSVYSRGSNGGVQPEGYNLVLNTDAAQVDSNAFWADTAPTATHFTIGGANALNNPGEELVAYLFAHDDSDESMIKCGSYEATRTAPLDVSLGWEPQWVLIKRTADAGDWFLFDASRGIVTGGDDRYLTANSSAQEAGGANFLSVNPDGFSIELVNAGVNGGTVGDAYIYMAIRRPNKPADEFEADDLFATAFDAGATNPTYVSGFVTDMGIQTHTAGYNKRVSSRLTSGRFLEADNTDAESKSTSNYTWDFMNGWNNQSINSTFFSWMWRRAPGFFDVVAYKGDGQVGREVPHNLGVVPEMMWIKGRNTATQWGVYHTAITPLKQLALDRDLAEFATDAFADTSPTESSFSVGLDFNTFSASGNTYIAYLFASVPGISKVGSYSGTGAELDVNCGFTTGARFVLIKRTDDAGDWYVWDTERGITSSRCNYLLLNTTDAQVTNTNYIELLSSGFKVTASAPAAINASGGEYLFYAVSS